VRTLGLPRQRLVLQVPLLLVLGLILCTLPFWAGDYWTRIWTGVAMWAGLALAWNIIGGYAGYISFGHVAFFGIGAYSTALLMQPARHWNFFLTLPVGAAAACLLAVVLGWPSLRLRGAYFAIATWAMAEALAQLANVVDFTGGSFGLSTPPNSSSSFFYYAMLITAAIAYVVAWVLLERSRFGYRVKAVRDNEVAAQSLGINATSVKLQAFVLSAIIPAIFGGIDAYWITFINPQSVLGRDITDQMVVMALVGGLGHAWGPALGATALYLINSWFNSAFGSTTSYIAMIGGLLALVVLFLPDGLVSVWPRTRRLRLVRQMLERSGLPLRPDRGVAQSGGDR
jgi:branched-chain amino acid transport system permease protein